MVDERHAQLERMPHAHPIREREDVVRQKELQVSSERAIERVVGLCLIEVKAPDTIDGVEVHVPGDLGHVEHAAFLLGRDRLISLPPEVGRKIVRRDEALEVIDAIVAASRFAQGRHQRFREAHDLAGEAAVGQSAEPEAEVALVAGKILAAKSGQRHGHVLSRHLADVMRRNQRIVREGLVEGRQRDVERFLDRGLHLEFPVFRPILSTDLAGKRPLDP